MSNHTNNTDTLKKKSLPVFLIVLIGGIILYALMLLISPSTPQIPKADLPWNSVKLPNGHVKVLGVETQHSTSLDVKALWPDDPTVTIFSNKDLSNKSAEIYFPSVHIGSIHGAFVIKVQVPKKSLEAMFDRGIKITINQQGHREVTPTKEDDLALKNSPFSSITLVPRSNLTKSGILKRFGKPQKITPKNGVEYWDYPKKGLQIIYDPNGPEALQYGDFKP